MSSLEYNSKRGRLLWYNCSLTCPRFGILIPETLCMYWVAKCAFRSSFLWAKATYRGLATMMRPFISVTALVASSGDEKQTKPKPLLRPSSVIT